MPDRVQQDGWQMHSLPAGFAAVVWGSLLHASAPRGGTTPRTLFLATPRRLAMAHLNLPALGCVQLRAKMHARFRHVLVDEGQDTNRCQFDIVRAITGPSSTLMMVGDPDQVRWAGDDDSEMAPA